MHSTPKDAFNSKGCFASPNVLEFGCWVTGSTIDRTPSIQGSRTGVIEFFNAGVSERHIKLGQILRLEQDRSRRRMECLLNRFIDTQCEGIPALFFAKQKDVSLSANRRYFGLLDTSVVNRLADNLLDRTLARIPGIHGSRLDISSGFGTPTCLHTTPAGLYSVSALLSGSSRIWIIISADQRLKFQKLMLEEFPDFDIHSTCSGCPHHKMLFLLPSFLYCHQIKYSYFEQQVGDIVVTIPGSFIQSYNTGANVVETSMYADKYWQPSSYTMCDPSFGISTDILPSTLTQFQVGQNFESAVWPDTRLSELLARSLLRSQAISDLDSGYKADSQSAPTYIPFVDSEDLIDLSQNSGVDQSLENSTSSLVGPPRERTFTAWSVCSKMTSHDLENIPYTTSSVSTLRASNASCGPLVDYDIYDAPLYLMQEDTAICPDTKCGELSRDLPSRSMDSASPYLSSSFTSITSITSLSSTTMISTYSHQEPTENTPISDAEINTGCSSSSDQPGGNSTSPVQVVKLYLESTSSDHESVSKGNIRLPLLLAGGFPVARNTDVFVVSPLLSQWFDNLNTTRSSLPSPDPRFVPRDINGSYFSVTIARIVASVGSKSSIRLWIAHMNATFWSLAKPARFSSCLSPWEEMFVPLQECRTTIEEILRTIASLDSIPSRSHHPYSNYLLLCHRWALQLDSMTGKAPKRRQRCLENFMMTYLGVKESDRNSSRWNSQYGHLTMWYFCGVKVQHVTEITSPVVAFLFSTNAEVPILKHEIFDLPPERIGLLAALLQCYRGDWIKWLHQAYRLWFERIRANPQMWKPIDLSRFHTFSECDTRILGLFY